MNRIHAGCGRFRGLQRGSGRESPIPGPGGRRTGTREDLRREEPAIESIVSLASLLERLFESQELAYVLLLFALFVLPRLIQRYRIPSAITSFALGAVAALGLGWFTHDPTLQLLSTFGIVSLFLFAGLEVDLDELRANWPILVQHVVVGLLIVAGVTWAIVQFVGVDVRAAVLISLALLTPSTGFILDSLHALGVSEKEQFWIRSAAIATELVALGLLFVTLQSVSVVRLSVSAMVLFAMIVFLPVVFKTFAAHIARYAPRSEFAFLVMVAVICATVTRQLGVYYLVGAFVVGMAADRFRDRLPAMASERMLHAVESFASFFVPFYFFSAGLKLKVEDFQVPALVAGAIMLGAIAPLRLASVALHRGMTMRENLRSSLRIGVPMLPTLVFGLVIIGIIRERYIVPEWLMGGLVIYTIGSTLIPGLFMHQPPPEYSALEIPALPKSVRLEEAPESFAPLEGSRVGPVPGA